MRYIKAKDILPPDLIAEIQRYTDGCFVYIPRATGRRKAWGAGTTTREELRARNEAIRRDRAAGASYTILAEKYFLSVKSIERILREK